MRSVLFRAIFVTLSTASVVSADQVDDLDSFLRENVINRTMTAVGKGEIADGKVAYEFQRDMTFCNLVRAGNAIMYDTIVVIKQRNQDLDEEGKPSGEPRVKDRILVTRHELAAKESTEEIIGFTRLLSTTMKNWRGYASEITVTMEDEKMLIRTATVGFDDFFGSGGKPFPGRSDVLEEYSSVEDKLQIKRISSKTIKLDPETREELEVKSDAAPSMNVQTAKLAID